MSKRISEVVEALGELRSFMVAVKTVGVFNDRDVVLRQSVLNLVDGAINNQRALDGVLQAAGPTPAELISEVRAALAESQNLAERLKQEAQAHAQEARTANATIAEIYQCVTGATGEPGNWHGAEPVRAAFALLREEDAARWRHVLANANTEIHGCGVMVTLSIEEQGFGLGDHLKKAALAVDHAITKGVQP
ncbi:hypothetical protein LP416_27680 [Polaromonas sp. P2-4]|nr:hypothetical protein LP416_27680 [Polaromonas sp. P2-4]